MYKISVAIPAYNEEGNIGMLIKTLLEQNEEGFKLEKILVASDASTDRTVEMVQLFKDPRVEVFAGRNRIGQNKRQNQLFDKLEPISDLILLLEADTLPVDNNYIANLVKAIPADGNFSYISGDTIPAKSVNFVSNILNIGYNLRHEIFFSSKNKNNLYLSTAGRLFSSKFAHSFRWKSEYHEDSYCYRKAVELGLPVIFSPVAKTYFKSVETVSDYLKQSIKFQKAKDKEEDKSEVYKLEINKLKALGILVKYLIAHPIATPSYILLFLYSRIASKFAAEYNQFWSIYSSSKNLKSYK